LRDRADTAAGLAQRIYTDTPHALLPAAECNVLAHLIDLIGKTRVSPQEDLRTDAVFLRLDSGG